MGQHERTSIRTWRAGRLLWLVVALAFLLLASPAQAQETPEPTPAADLARFRVVPPEESVSPGDEFEVQVVVEDVEHLAAFDFLLTFDPAVIEFVRMTDTGAIFAPGQRDHFCADPQVRDDTIALSCATRGQPVCFGGPPGVSGAGVLARVFFTAVDSGKTALELGDPIHLLLDDVEPCDPEEGFVVEIPHVRENATIEISGGGGFPWLIVGPVIGVVALIVAGVVGLQYARRRRVLVPSEPERAAEDLASRIPPPASSLPARSPRLRSYLPLAGRATRLSEFGILGIILLIGAGILAIIGAILPWAEAPFGISKAGVEGDGAITLVLGVILVSLPAVRFVRPANTGWYWITVIGGGLLSAAILIIAIIDIADVERTTGESAGLIKVGSGLYVTAVAGGLGFVGSVVSAFGATERRN